MGGFEVGDHDRATQFPKISTLSLAKTTNNRLDEAHKTMVTSRKKEQGDSGREKWKCLWPARRRIPRAPTSILLTPFTHGMMGER